MSGGNEPDPGSGRILALGVEARVRRLHQRGVGLTRMGRPAAGSLQLRAALGLLGWQPDRDVPKDVTDSPKPPAWWIHAALTARVLISLGYAEAEQGRTERGLGLLDEAETLVASHDRGLLLQQRGLVLVRAGRTRDALPLLDAAIPLLDSAGEFVVLARTLLTRTVLHFYLGNVRLAQEDVSRCERLVWAHGDALLVAKTMHNRGYCDVLTGDIPSALRAFDAAARGYGSHGVGYLPTLTVDKARALLAAGLAREAGRELDAAFELFHRDRYSQDYAEAELTRAQAALAAGDFATARSWADRARRRFRRHGNNAWAELASLTRIRADFYTTRSPVILAAQAHRLARRLRQLELVHDAESAELLSVRALVMAGRLVEAARRVSRFSYPRSGVPLETRLLRRLTYAELDIASGRRGKALAQLRAGLTLLQQHRSRFGSLELRTGFTALGAELARTGLAAALDAGAPRLVFAWAERSRAQAFRIRPVQPAADPETVEAVAELRQLTHVIRMAELNGHREPQARGRRVELERMIRQRAWQLRGTGESSEVADFPSVAAELAASERTMVSFLSQRGRLLALVIKNGSAQLLGLGDYQAVAEAVRRLLTDLDVLCGRRLPARIEAVIQASVRHQVTVLTGQLLLPLRHLLGDHDVVLVPTMELSAIPWGLLPDLRCRPVTVSPSASTWLAARRSRSSDSVDGAPILVAGPHLDHAGPEVDKIAKIYPRSHTLSGDKATVEATLRALDGVPVAHLVAHGHHEPENVLFSRLDLVDGPLMAYDIERLAIAPRQVILSACDVGQATVRTGDEILGFTAALLYAGTATVVSSVARVPDDTAVGVMTAYHRAIAAGAEPAQALATASLTEPLVSFVCFGSG